MGALVLGFGILLSCFIGVSFTQQAKVNDVEDFRPSTIVPLPQEPSQRIVGGRDADEGQFPYQVSLRYRNGHVCGGAIISATFVVTAAHCVTASFKGKTQVYPASSLSIRAGTNDITSGGVTMQVAQVIAHPNYRNFLNDIALLRLNTALSLTQRIRAIPVATANTASGSQVLVSGWGRLQSRGTVPRRLQYVTLNAMTNAECQRILGRVPESILCLAHRSGQGVCQGDSGGPAAFNNQLVGITNFVIGSCGTSAPDGFASIFNFASWIRQNSN